MHHSRNLTTLEKTIRVQIGSTLTADCAFPAGIAIFVERRTLVMLALGFSSGLPFLLIFDTLSVWLRATGLSLEAIGFFSLVTLVYSVSSSGRRHSTAPRCPF